MLYSEIKNHKSLFVDSGAITPFSHFHLFQCDGDDLKNKIILQFLFAPSNCPVSPQGSLRWPNGTQLSSASPSASSWGGVVAAIGQRP
jgi:hypothetical protein